MHDAWRGSRATTLQIKDGIFLGDGAASQDFDFKHSNKVRPFHGPT